MMDGMPTKNSNIRRDTTTRTPVVHAQAVRVHSALNRHANHTNPLTNAPLETTITDSQSSHGKANAGPTGQSTGHPAWSAGHQVAYSQPKGTKISASASVMIVTLNVTPRRTLHATPGIPARPCVR